ncbi:MAG TPA: hypothetical protein VIE91_05875 [Methylophilaceae bacterium]|jgi:hypothetical protein
MSYRAYAVASKANAGGRRHVDVSLEKVVAEAARVSYQIYVASAYFAWRRI